MKTILLIFTLVTTSFAGFTVCVPVTINHVKVPNTDQTDFAIPICANGGSGDYCDAAANSNLSATTFKTIGNGGRATSSSGFDINWFSDASCTATLPFYFIPSTYVPTTGYGKWYVKKTILTASDVTIYAGVGNAAITTNQSTSAWTSTFKAVWPFGGAADVSGPVSGDILADATGNGFNLSAGSGTPPNSRAIGFDLDSILLIPGSPSTSTNNDQPVHVLASGLPVGTSDRTLIFYASDPTISGSNGYAFGMGLHAAHKQFNVRYVGTSCTNCCGTGNLYNKTTFSIQCNADDVNSAVGYCSNEGDTGNWTMHQIAFKLSSAGSVMDIYVDGALDTHSTGHSCNTDISGNGQYASWNTDGDCVAFGCAAGSSARGFTYAKMADSALSADYIATENNAISSPQTFLTFGSPILLGGGIRHRISQ